MEWVKYKRGFKYQLAETYEVKVRLEMKGLNIITKYINLYSNSVLRIKEGEDGMCKVRAWWVYSAVKTFAKRSASPENKKVVLTAP